MSALTVSAVVRSRVAEDGRERFFVTVTDDFYSTRLDRAARKWGLGTVIQIRLEPAAEAWRHSSAKHLYGHLYTPVSKRTGEPVADVHLRMKAQWFPDDGRTSLTELNEIEMRSFIESVEQDIRENDPDSWEDCLAAMALYEGRQPQRRPA